MAEYIEREAVIEFGERQLKRLDDGEAYRRLDAWLNSIPAADVRPVVLCRDCKNNYNTCLNHGRNEPMCDFTDRKLKEDDFCSHGVKREES